MRRLFGSCGNAARQDALLAAGVDTAPDEESENAAWAAHRRARNVESAAKIKTKSRDEP